MTRLESLVIIIKQKGSCSYPEYIDCNKDMCALKGECTHDMSSDKALSLAIKELSKYSQEELFEAIL